MGLKDKSTNHHLNPRDLIPSTKIVGSSFQTLSTSLSHKHHLSPIRRSTTRLTTDSVQLLSASTTNIASDYAISPEQVTSESTNNNYFSLSSNSNYNYIVKSSGVIRRKPLLVLTFNHTRPTKASLHFDSDCSLSSGLLLTRSRAIGGVTISSEGDNLTRERFLSITRYHRLRLKRIYEVQRALRQQEGELNKLTLSAVEIRAKIELIEKFETYIEWLKRSQPQLSDKVFYCRHKDQSIDKCEFDSVGTANFKMIHRVGTLSPSRYKFLDDTGEVSKPKRSRVPQNRVASESSSKIEALSRGLQENLVLSSVSSFSAAGSVGDGEHATDIKTRAVSTPSKLLSPSPLLSSTSHASISAEGTDASAHSSQHTSIVLPSPTSSITSKNSKRHERPENIDILSPKSSKSQLSFISSSGSSVVKSPTSGSENSKSTNSSFKVSPKRTITQRHSKRSLKEKKLPPLPISNDSSSASTSSRGPSPVHSKSMSLSGNNESVVSKIHHRTSSLEATKLGMVQSSSCALSISPINVQRSPIKKYFDLSAKPSELIQYDTAENDDNKASKIREMSMIEDINQTMNLSIREKEEQDLEPQIYSKQKNCNHNNEVKIESETKDTPINGKETNTLSLNTIVLQQPLHSFNQLGAPADSFGISYSSSLKDFTECMSKEYSSVSRESSPIKDMSDITLTEISSEISKSELTKELITDTCEVSNTTVLSKNLSQKPSNQTFIQTPECQLPLSTRSSSLQYLEHSIPSPPEETDYSFAFNSDQVSKHEIMPRSPGSESVVDIPTPATFDFDNVELCHSPIQSILSKSYNNQACNINFGVTSDEGIGLSDGTYNIETSRASTSSDSIMRDSKIGDRKNISLISTASSVFSNVSEADIYNGSGADIGTPSLTLSKARYSGSASSYVNSLRREYKKVIFYFFKQGPLALSEFNYLTRISLNT